MKLWFTDIPRKLFEKEVCCVILFSLPWNWSYLCERTVRFISPNTFFLYFLLLWDLQLVLTWGWLCHVAGRRHWGMEEVVAQVPCVLCVGTEWGCSCVLLLSPCTVLQLAFPAGTRLFPLLPVRLLKSSQEVEFDFSLFLMECLTATYSGLAL